MNVYVLDSKGITQWNKDKTINYPVFAFKNVKQDVYTFELTKRDKYAVVIYNSASENVTIRWTVSVYGIEKDLLHTSIVVIITGLLLMTTTVIYTKNDHVLKCFKL
ncbi:MAG: hypothetical protein LBC12_01100 [Nitrososphaerota archaeon]|nr:hypothetical protein [Nitrososphaerota archaeon]